MAIALDHFAEQIGLTLDRREEYVLAHGVADAAYNRLIIEYERPHSLGAQRDNHNTKHAVGQVKDYVEQVAEKEGVAADRLIGVVTDGSYFVFLRRWPQGWQEDTPAPVDGVSVRRFLRLLVSMAVGRALLADNLVEDFGSGTDAAMQLGAALYHSLAASLQREPEALPARLFQQWDTFFNEVSAYQSAAADSRAAASFRKLAAGLGVPERNLRPAQLMFTLHTYYAIIIKLIAYHALAPMLGAFGNRLQSLSQAPAELLRSEMAALERGGAFRDQGIHNFLEADFFGWYTYAWTAEAAAGLQRVCEQLVRYDPATTDINPEGTRDLLKQLYQMLIPRQLRHDLGEYYTPDWLAERVLHDSGFLTNTSARVVDPTCGSGTFLTLAIREKRRASEARGVNERETLAHILSTVVGIDLNPLAVVAARTNYVLALGSLLRHRVGDIEIPVYLADSIHPPSLGDTLEQVDRYRLSTAVGTFEIPSIVRSRDQVVAFTAHLERYIEGEFHPSVFLEHVEKDPSLAIPATRWDGTDGLGEPARLISEQTFSKLARLHRDGLNGIWARVVKNGFMPLFIGRFDYVLGNPPWVQWESLPEEYRVRTAQLWRHYGLTPRTGRGAGPRLGAHKLDLSYLATYVACDRYLETGGHLAFLITQAALKSAGAGEGFRTFLLPNGVSIGPVLAEDLGTLQVFDGATNRTAVIVLAKGKAVSFPVPYAEWSARQNRLADGRTLSEILAQVNIAEGIAEPSRSVDAKSSWLSGSETKVRLVKRVLGRSSYKAHAGVYTGGANAVFWVDIMEEHGDLVLVQNLVEAGKGATPQVSALVERSTLWPLVRSKDVGRWSARPSAWHIVAQDPDRPSRSEVRGNLQRRAPRTWEYLHRFEAELRGRSGFRQIIGPQGSDFYGLMDIDSYTFAPWKVVWNQMASSVNAAVMGGRATAVPQHTVALVAVKDEIEAFYLAGMLNSGLFNLAVTSFAQVGGKGFASPHVLQVVRIPPFDKKVATHRELATLARRSTEAVDVGGDPNGTDKDVDALAAQIWGVEPGDVETLLLQQSSGRMAKIRTRSDKDR